MRVICFPGADGSLQTAWDQVGLNSNRFTSLKERKKNMVRKITLACGFALALCVLIVSAALAAYADKGITIRADQLPGMCIAGGGHVTVPPNSALRIVGGTALIHTECDITPGNNASVFIVNATIDARPGGDFDVCFFPPCGTGVKVHVDNSTLYSGPPTFSGGFDPIP